MLSHYRLVEKIGEGGMGVVWKADDTVLNRTVAIKVLPADLALDEERRRMFLDEARLAASVSHAHIVQVYELGREGDLDFIVMEYVEGQPLSKLLHGRPLSPEKVADWGLQVAEGLARAHRKGLIHRDLKPANILVTPDGELKIVDFGLATLFSRPDATTGSWASTLTDVHAGEKAREIAGTLPYMSPEQVRGEKLDARSDIFSFGTVIYEMTTGQRPFTGTKPADIAQEILRSQPTPVHELVPKVPLDLDRIIEKALARHPGDRYQHMDDLVVDLKRLTKDLDSGSSPSFEDLQQNLQPKRRLRSMPLVAVISLLGIASIAWISWVRHGEGQDQADTASTTPGKPNWIVVADFEAPGLDSTFAVAARELVTGALQQSQVVMPLSRSQVRRALEMAAKSPNTRVVGEVARELAIRATARSYLEGRVDRILRGYSIVLNVVDAENGTALLSVRGIAENDEVLISTLDRIVRDLQTKLGERKSVLRGTHRILEAYTPSLEAYRAFLQAEELAQEGSNRASIPLYRHALNLDPDFARAWMGLGIRYRNMHASLVEGAFLDSAQVAWNEALRRPERLSDPDRLRLQAIIASSDSAAVQACDLLVRLYPFDSRAHLNRGVYLAGLGRDEEALEAYKRAGEVDPFGPTQLVLGNQFNLLFELGRYSEINALLQRLRGLHRQDCELRYGIATTDWGKVEALAQTLSTDPSTDVGVRCKADVFLAGLQVSRGEVKKATSRFGHILADADADWARDVCLALANMELVRGRLTESTSPPDRCCSDTTAAGLIVAGVWATIRGDSVAGRRALDTLGRKPDLERRKYAVDTRFLEAWIAAGSSQWEDVVQLLKPFAERGPGGPKTTGRLAIRWLVADAYERLGRPDAAVASFEQVVSPVGLVINRDVEQRAIFYSFAHHRLVLLYARMGRVEDARRHWEIFRQSFTKPDTELLPMIDEARQALAAAEAKS